VRFIFICSLDKKERVTIYAKEELIRSIYVDRNVAKYEHVAFDRSRVYY
jgi:hypothetical protein